MDGLPLSPPSRRGHPWPSVLWAAWSVRGSMDQVPTGSNAGRGFRCQDADTTGFALRAWSDELPVIEIVSEGDEDVSLRLRAGSTRRPPSINQPVE